MSEETFSFKSVEHRVLEGKKGVIQAYDSMSSSYDHSEFLYWTRRMEEGEERTIRRWLSNLSAPVLDVGCGTGRYSTTIAESGSEVIALDASSKMLGRAVEKAAKRNVSQMIDFVLADAEHLPFRDGSFGGLICTLTLNHFQDCESAAREFGGVLKKDGSCILTTFNSYTLNDFKRRHNLPPDKVPFRSEDLSPALIYEVGHSANEVENLFGKYGFDTADVKGCCYWHLLPTGLMKRYRTELDSLLNLIKPLLKYAETHAVLLRKI